MTPTRWWPTIGLRHSLTWRTKRASAVARTFTKRLLARCGWHVKARRQRLATPNLFMRIKGSCVGQRCFIVGTGPSIRTMDLSPLNGEKVFSVNRAYDLSDLGISSIFGYVISDPAIAGDYVSEIKLAGIEYVFVGSTFPQVPLSGADELFVYDIFDFPKMHEGHFSDDLLRGVYQSHTVIHHAVQIAAYMGFTEIYIVGVDLDFDPEDLHFYRSSRRERDDGIRRSIAHADKMISGFEVAGRHLGSRGVSLFNAGRGGRLNTIGRVQFQDIFRDRRRSQPEASFPEPG